MKGLLFWMKSWVAIDDRTKSTTDLDFCARQKAMPSAWRCRMNWPLTWQTNGTGKQKERRMHPCIFLYRAQPKQGWCPVKHWRSFFFFMLNAHLFPKPSKALPALSEDLRVNSFEALLAPSKAFPAASDLSASPYFYSSRTEYISEWRIELVADFGLKTISRMSFYRPKHWIT